MPRKLFALLALAFGLLSAAPAWASGDFDCSVIWKLSRAELDDCNNLPFLSPGNDSRVNLQLLLLDAGKAKLHTPAPPKNTDREGEPQVAGAIPFSLGDLNDMIEPPPAAAATGADASSDHADGEGSRCDSNATGADQFNAALATSPSVPADDKQALTAARAALAPKCADDPKAPAVALPPVAAHSALGKQFAAYLSGAQAFYDGRYDAAAQSFGALQASGQPWLKETARYMLGRVALNRAQASAFNEYGQLQTDKVDAKALAGAAPAFNAYLHDYPKGAYAASARGLLRRAAWLGKRDDDLAKTFAQAFLTDPNARNVSEVSLVLEADSKLLTQADPADIHDPLILAVVDLLHMRTSPDSKTDKPMERAALEAQKPVFASQPALFNYLLAAHAYYDEKAPAAALALLPATPQSGPMSYLTFSNQVLRGLALEDTGDHARARTLWLALMPAARPPFQHATLELALAMNYERGGALPQVYAAGSPITDPDIRQVLLQYAAGPALLRQQAKGAGPQLERREALYTLLYKEVTRGRYQDFVGDLALMPPPPPPATGDNQVGPNPDFSTFRWDGRSDEGYDCPPARKLAEALARDPKDAGSLVCLAELVRANNLDDNALDKAPPAAELGGAPTQFPGEGYSRLESYKVLLANPKTPPGVRAYVLYRAVQCYGPSGYNHCGGRDVPKTQRKAWFQTLKSDYASSDWAQKLKYYW